MNANAEKKSQVSPARRAAQIETRLWLLPQAVSKDEVVEMQQHAWGASKSDAEELTEYLLQGLSAHRNKNHTHEYMHAKSYYTALSRVIQRGFASEPIALAEQTWWEAHDKLTEGLALATNLSQKMFFYEYLVSNKVIDSVLTIKRQLETQTALLIGVDTMKTRRAAAHKLTAILYYSKLRHFQNKDPAYRQQDFAKDREMVTFHLEQYYELVNEAIRRV